MAEDTQRFSDGTAYEQFMGRWTRAIGTIFLDWLAPPADARTWPTTQATAKIHSHDR